MNLKSYKNKLLLFTFFISLLNVSYAQTQFSCSGAIYQVSGEVGRGNVSLYSYNINTGTRTLVAPLGRSVNAIAYNTVDNMIWGYDQNSFELVRIDANGAVTGYTIPNLPNDIYNSADFLPDGRLLFYRTDTGTSTLNYYVVDLNPSRTSSYLKLVDPTQTGFPLDTAPFGSTMSRVTLTNDFVYNPSTGLTVGIGTGANLGKIVRMNPVTGAVTVASNRVTGDGIESVTGAFGATFIDAGNENILYVFSNSNGSFYRVDLLANTATKISTAAPAGNNDGASCPTAILSYPITGNVFNDANGLNDSFVNGNKTTLTGLNAVLYNNTTGKVEGIDPIPANGSFNFGATPGNSYTVYLTTNATTIGQTTPPTISLPAGWMNTGENVGTTPSNDGTGNGILSIGSVNSAITDANFGIQRLPISTDQSYTLSEQPHVNQLIPLDGSFSTVQPLIGSDAEDMPSNGNLTGKSIRIETLPTNGELYYNNILIEEGTTINNLDPSQLKIKLTGASYTSTSFTWSYIDAAGQASTLPGTYSLNWQSSLPVQLASFIISNEGQFNVLNWLTTAETHSSHFVIERSQNGFKWTTLGQVKAIGESTVDQLYSFQDSDPLNGQNLYRLKMVDIDGTYSFSMIKSASISHSITSFIYPNPASHSIHISSDSYNLKQAKQVRIFNFNGKAVSKPSYSSENGIDISGLNPGSYILHITMESGETFKSQFIIVR